MLVTLLTNDENERIAVVTLEPGNFANLQAGHPIALSFGSQMPDSLIITYTPDVEWLAGEMLKASPATMHIFAAKLDESLKRKPVFRDVPDAIRR